MRTTAHICSLIMLLAALSLAPSRLKAAEWFQVDQLSGGEFLTVYSDGSQLIAGGSGIVYRQSSCGVEWEAGKLYSPTADNISAMILVNDRLFVGGYNEGVRESTDGGQSWQARNTGLTGLGANSPLAFARRGDSLYVATAGAGVFVMDLNDSPEWSPYRDGLGSSTEWTVNSLANVAGVLVAGAGANGTTARHDNGAAAWQSLRFSEFKGQPLVMLDVEAAGSDVYGVGSDGLYFSADAGETWEQHQTSIGLIGDGAIAAVENGVFAMTNWLGQGTRIYRRVQGSWALYDELAQVYAWDMAIHCNRIYLATTDGVWYRQLDATDAPDDGPILPESFTLAQNYPNPFNPITSIEFSLGRGGRVKLSIYNVLGQLVSVLVDEERAAGSHVIEWNGTNHDGSALPSGIYFYRLTVGDQTSTRKMILMK